MKEFSLFSGLSLPFRDRWFLGIILLVVLLGGFYNSTLLLAHDVDEGRHMNYVELLLDEQRLPYIISTHPYEEYKGAHAFHPPLYYLLLLPFYAAVRSLPYELKWHLIRGLSLLICLAALPLIYQIAYRIGAPRNGNGKETEKEGAETEPANSRAENLARLAVAQIALIPMFGMTANMVNNDSICFLAVTLFLWLLVVVYPEERSLKSAAVLGVVWGLGALTKSTALLCNGVALLIYFAVQEGKFFWRSLQVWKRFGTAFFFLLLIAGWWHVRSYMLYGSLMPLPPAMPSPALPSPEQGTLVMMMHDNFPFHFVMANWKIFTTLWSQKDWIPSAIREPIYWLLALYCAVPLASLLFRTLQNRKEADGGSSSLKESSREDSLSKTIALWAAPVMFLVNWLTVLQVALFWHWGWSEGGRYLLPSFCGLSFLLAYGWRTLLPEKLFRSLTGVWIGAMLGLNIPSLYWLITYLNPTFGG